MEELTKIIKDLLTGWGLKGLAEYVGLILFFLLGSGVGVGILTGLWKLMKAGVNFRNRRILNRDLHPFFTPVEIKKATRYYVPTQCQNIAPSKELEPIHTHAFATKEKLIPFFMKKAFKFKTDINAQRFYIILADSGMGKTTFMINLYLRYISQWFGKKYSIKLLPMGYPDIDKELDRIKIEQKRNMVLLLDAFDEDNEAVKNYKDRLDKIIKEVKDFRKVIFTCRTQFFPSEEEEPGETGILKFGGDKGSHIFRKLYISPFDEKDIKRYLNKKFSIFNFKKKSRARQIVRHSPNLMVRPMLLSYIDDLLKGSRNYELTSQVYGELINKWIERESRRVSEKDKREHFRKELYKFSQAVALDIYRHRESRKGLIINAQDIEPFAKEHKIQLEQMEMKSRSLLNRNAQGKYKFSHKSVLEYFLALELANSIKFYNKFSFDGMEQAKNFYTDIRKECTFAFLTKDDLQGYYKTELAKRSKELSKIKLNELENLVYLNLNNNQLTDISGLKELKGLEILDLSNNQLDDISGLKELKGLERLYLRNNQLTDISGLKELKNLWSLDLSNNQLTDIGILKELKKLMSLHLNNNPISIEQIEALKKAKPTCHIVSN